MTYPRVREVPNVRVVRVQAVERPPARARARGHKIAGGGRKRGAIPTT